MRKTPFDKADYILAAIRKEVSAGRIAPIYRFNRATYDAVPLYSFLVAAATGTEGRVFRSFSRVVLPTNSEHYAQKRLSPGRRLIYCFWQEGKAVKGLLDAREADFAHIVLPDDPAYRLIEAFKVACDTKRAWASGPVDFPADIAYKALGIERPWVTIEV